MTTCYHVKNNSKTRSGVTTYGVLGSSLRNSVYFAAAVSLTVKFRKFPKKNMYYIFIYLSRNTQNMQSWTTKEISGREGVEKFMLCPPHLVSWRRHWWRGL